MSTYRLRFWMEHFVKGGEPSYSPRDQSLKFLNDY